MSKEYKDILESALALPQNEFFALVQALLGKVQDKISAETGVARMPWETDELFQELDRRAEEIRSGKVKPIPGDEVMEKLKKRSVK
jgi:putative addiction module component (TIGR02574 family)